MTRPIRRRFEADSSFMDVHQVAEYLHINEKKVYALVGEGTIPATKVTGKWLFARELIDRWLLESSHDGLLNDRLLIAGGDDALLHRAANRLARDTGRHALIGYSPTGTRLGLELLQAGHVDASVLNWGPAQESDIRHPALIQLHSAHPRWVLVRGFGREQGLLVSARTREAHPRVDELLKSPVRWALRQAGSGSRRFMLDTLRAHGIGEDDIPETVVALSEREAAAAVRTGIADVACGTRSVGSEFGLEFLPLGWERVDLVLDKRKWFRHLVQRLLKLLQSTEIEREARQLGGYRSDRLGEIAWGEE